MRTENSPAANYYLIAEEILAIILDFLMVVFLSPQLFLKSDEYWRFTKIRKPSWCKSNLENHRCGISSSKQKMQHFPKEFLDGIL